MTVALNILFCARCGDFPNTYCFEPSLFFTTDLAKDMRTSDFITNFVKGQGVSMRYGAGGFAIDGSHASVIKT